MAGAHNNKVNDMHYDNSNRTCETENAVYIDKPLVVVFTKSINQNTEDMNMLPLDNFCILFGEIRDYWNIGNFLKLKYTNFLCS